MMELNHTILFSKPLKWLTESCQFWKIKIFFFAQDTLVHTFTKLRNKYFISIRCEIQKNDYLMFTRNKDKWMARARFV